MTRVLFLCRRNACRSQMAEGFARAKGLKGVEVTSAGTEPSRVHPLAVRVMKEAGVDISSHVSKAMSGLASLDFDIVITMCNAAATECPILPGNPERVDWNLPDPEDTPGDEQAVLAAFRAGRDRIRSLVDDFFDRGYLEALLGAKQHAEMILDTISDGIIAHDLDRRIFYFNKAAEQITGYRRDEVINRDCHSVLPGGLCGGKCAFPDGCPPDLGPREQELEIATKSGERRLVRMVVRPIEQVDGRPVGVLSSFKDLTRERTLARRVREIQQFSGIIGRDDKMLEIYDLIRDLAEATVPVLIQGESGTGKELVAAAIHNEGPRANKLFVPVNCGALPESLLESELFGHVKGAFTGAIRDKKGRFELADGGTIFLDEIGDISPAMQVKLMRVLQEGTFERVGGEKTMKVDVRIISATNRDLQKEIAGGRFRDDLFYRLSVVPITLPPLRERRNDIPLLVEHVLKRAIEDSGRKGVTVSAGAMDLMMSYDWPGNIRELQNWIQYALVKCKGPVIQVQHLPPSRHRVAAAPAEADAGADLPHRRRKLSMEAVREALRQSGGSKVDAARLLGISRATLYRLLDDTPAEQA